MEIEQLNAKVDTALHAFEEFKKANDANEKKHDTVLDEKINKLTDVVADAMEAKQKVLSLEKALEQTQATLQRLGASSGEGEKSSVQEIEHKAAFNRFLRRGSEDGLLELQQKALSVGSDPDGGYFVTPEISSQIVKRIFETSPIRAYADVISISSDSIEMDIDDNELTSGGWVSEAGARSETATPQVGKLDFPTFEQYAEPRATQKLLDDSAVNIEQWLSGKISDKFARFENTAFVSGDGAGKPKGFLSYSNYAVAGVYERGKVEQIVSGTSGAVTADGLLSLQNALKEAYQRNAAFMLKRTTFGSVAKLKDSQNNYLFNRELVKNVGEPFSLLGKPVAFADDMPAVAANALAIAYGDFREGYLIVDRIGVRILRDPYTAKPFVKFYATKRVGGGLKNGEAIKLQKLA